MIANVNKLITNSEILKSTDFEIFLRDYKCVDVIYPGVDDNLDFISSYAQINKVKINDWWSNKHISYLKI